jgi:Predicted permeases
VPIDIVAKLLFQMVFLAALGFMMRKRKIIDESFQKGLSTILLDVVVPIYLVGVGNSAFDRAMAGRLAVETIIVLLIFMLGYPLAILFARLVPIKKENKMQLVNLLVLCNVAYLGFPVMGSLFGDEGTLYTVVYVLLFNVFAFSVGIRLVGGKMSMKSFLLRPVIIACVVAVGIFVSPLRLPVFLVETCQMVGSLTSPFSMFIVGASLAQIKLSSIWRDGWVWLTCFMRQFVIPLCLAGILWLLGFRGVLPTCLLILTAMPTATTNVIFAEQYNLDIAFATRTPVLGTILMLFSLPIFYYLSGMIFNG